VGIGGRKFLSFKKEFSLTELNKPEDWENLADMAKKHVPVIEAPEKVKAKEPVEFAPEMCNGYVAQLHVTLSETATLRALAFCNLHGTWEGKEKKVIVG